MVNVNIICNIKINFVGATARLGRLGEPLPAMAVSAVSAFSQRILKSISAIHLVEIIIIPGAQAFISKPIREIYNSFSKLHHHA